MKGILLIALLMVSGCATVDTSERLKEINDRPLLADSFEVKQIAPIKLAPLEKFKKDSTGAYTKRSLLKVDSQRRIDRNTATELSQALIYSSKTQEHLVAALKSTELSMKATERMQVKAEAEAERQYNMRTIEGITHKVIEVLLLGLLFIPGVL